MIEKLKNFTAVLSLVGLGLILAAPVFSQVKVLSVTSRTRIGQISQDSSGWSDDGTVVRLTTLTDKVGIGSASAVSRLHLSQSANYTAGFGFKITTANTGSLLADGFDLFFDSSNNLYFSNNETGYIRFDTDGSGRLTIASNGGLVVGAATGGTQGANTVNASAYYIDGVLFTPGSAGGWTDDGTIVRLTTATDKVGVGLALPVTSLHISQGATYAVSAGLKLTTTNSGSTLTDGFDMYFDSSNNLYFRNVENGSIQIEANTTPGLTVAANGGIVAGTATGGTQGAGTVNSTGYYINGVPTPDYVEFLGTTLTGATDTTAYDVPSKAFATGDSAFFDFSVSKRFTGLDSVVAYVTTTSTSGDSAAFSFRTKKIAEDGSVSAAYNAATVDTVDMGAGVLLKVFRWTSFGVLASGAGELVGVVKRTACTNDMTAKALLRRIKFHGKGLR